MDKDRIVTKLKQARRRTRLYRFIFLRKLQRRLRFYRIKFLRRIRRLAPHHSRHWVLVAIILLPVMLTYGCSKLNKSNASSKPTAIPVLASAVETKDVPIYIMALGTVTPINTVTVKTQIEGRLLAVHFKDGQMINQGDLLAEIDPSPYQALLKQYQGQLVRDKALLDNANIDLKRYQTLFSQDSTSQQTLATQLSLVNQYSGAVQADKGQIDTVKVNLNYCKITAPISGKLGLINVDPGNIVQVSDTTGIVTINSISPIYIDFPIPEDNLPQVALKMSKQQTLIAIAQDRTQNRTLATGSLLTTDNQINTSTGTITLRSIFTNEDQMLFPNQFVNIKLQVDELQQATVVDTAAIQYGANGTYVYILNSDNTVSMKSIKILGEYDGKTAISGDVKTNQFVITEGTDKLKDGSLVSVLKDSNELGKEDNESI
jgi:multidrug efflux system membrane fusion protein